MKELAQGVIALVAAAPLFLLHLSKNPRGDKSWGGRREGQREYKTRNP
jgi:hypothetical protein